MELMELDRNATGGFPPRRTTTKRTKSQIPFFLLFLASNNSMLKSSNLEMLFWDRQLLIHPMNEVLM
jgi:hypothetical protein